MAKTESKGVKFEVIDPRSAYLYFAELNIQFRNGTYETSDEAEIAYLRNRIDDIKEVK